MKQLKLMTVIGTRPEIIRLSAVISRADAYFEQILVHTGQNYDYALNQVFFEELRKGMYAGVVSNARMESIIRTVYNTSTYIMDPYGALAYCGLQDYRNRYAESRPALVLCERSPIHFADTVSRSIGISKEELAERMNLI